MDRKETSDQPSSLLYYSHAELKISNPCKLSFISESLLSAPFWVRWL